MNCKFCNAELPEEITLCPACGKENAEEIPEVDAMETEEAVAAEAAEEAAEETAEEAAEETTEETAEEAPAKPKRSLWVTILAVIGGIALLAVLAGAVLFGMKSANKLAKSYTVSDAKAQKESATVVATVGTQELTNSELQIYYWQSIKDFYSYLSYYMDVSSLNLDLSKPLDEQFYDEEQGITWQQNFLEAALDTWHRYAALATEAEQEGFVLDAESEAYLADIPNQLEEMALTYGYTSAQEMLTKDMGAACDVDGYMRFIRTNYLVGQYYDSLYVKMEPTLEELETYYAENEEAVLAMGIEQDGSRYVSARHILFCPTGGTTDEQTGEVTYSEAEWEACREQAQTLLDQWLAEGTGEDGFAQLATIYTQDPGSQSNGGLYTNMTVGQMVKPFEEWCFDESRQYGDSGLVKTDYGYHIMFFVSAEETWIADLTSQLVNERSTALVEEIIAKYPIQTNMKKVVLCDTTVQ